MLLFSKCDRNRHRCTDTDQVGKREVDHHKRHGNIHSRKSTLAKPLPDKSTFNDAVDRHGKHTHHSGQCHHKKEPPRTHCSIHRFGIAFHAVTPFQAQLYGTAKLALQCPLIPIFTYSTIIPFKWVFVNRFS